MTRNIDPKDRLARTILGLALIAVFFAYTTTLWTWAALILGLYLLYTAIMSLCIIYTLLGMTTIEDDQDA